MQGSLGEERGNRIKALMVMIAVLMIWSMDFIAIEYMMNYASAGAYTMMRLLISSVILLAAVSVRKGGLKIKKEDWPRVIICGATAMSLYFTLENYGIKLTSASFGSLVLSTVPIFGIIGDRIFYRTKITRLKIICIAVSIVGVYILVASELENSGLAGLAVTLAAAVMWAFQIAYVKPLYDKYDMLTILTGLFVSGTVVQVPVTLIGGFHFEFTAASVAVTVVTAIICLVIGEAGYLFAIGNLTVTTVSAFENLIPVTTIILSFLIFGAMLSSSQLIGAILIIGSVMCIALRE